MADEQKAMADKLEPITFEIKEYESKHTEIDELNKGKKEDEIPQVDKFYGKFNWKELLHDLGKTYHEELYIERTLTTPKHYAYLKISEGCARKCS